MGKRHEVSDEEWAVLDSVIPKPTAKTGRPARNRREMLNGLLWILCTGAQWRDLPERFGPWATVYCRFNAWRKAGIYDAILDVLHVREDRLGVVVHRRHVGAGFAVGGGRVKKSLKTHPDEPADHALGRSRGGFGAKFHIVADGKGTPLAVEVTAGQVHDSTRLEPVLTKLKVHQKQGRPKSRPKQLAGDKAYSSRSIRTFLKGRGIEAVIPHRDDEAARHDPEVEFDKATYKRRSIVEQTIGWLKECRRIGTRFEKLAINFLAMVKLAMIKRALRLLFSNRA
jgi:transposase